MGTGKGRHCSCPNTYCYCSRRRTSGAKPIFVDCNLYDGNINTSLLEKRLQKNKSNLRSSFFRVPAEMNVIKRIANKFKLFLIEDCALSLGATYNGKHTGLFGDAGVFSLPSKTHHHW